MRKFILLFATILFLSNSNMINAEATTNGTKDVITNTNELNQTNKHSIFIDEKTKENIIKCYNSTNCKFFSIDSGQYIDFDHIVHINHFNYPNDSVQIDDSNIQQYLEDDDLYMVQVLDKTGRGIKTISFFYNYANNNMHSYCSYSIDDKETNVYKLLLRQIELEDYVGEKIEDAYYVNVGNYVNVDQGIIYKTSNQYKYVSLSDDYSTNLPNTQAITLSDYNKKLNKIDANNLGNGFIITDTNQNPSNSNNTKNTDEDSENSKNPNINDNQSNNNGSEVSINDNQSNNNGSEVNINDNQSNNNGSEVSINDNQSSNNKSEIDINNNDSRRTFDNKQSEGSNTGDSASLTSLLIGSIALFFSKKNNKK